MSKSLCPFRYRLYKPEIENTRQFFRHLEQIQIPENRERVATALLDDDLIDVFEEVLDGYLLIGVYNDLVTLAKSRVLYAKLPKQFIPDLDDLFLPATPAQYPVDKNVKKRPTHRQAYIRYFDLFITPEKLVQESSEMTGANAFFARHPLLRHVLDTLTNNFQQNIKLALERLQTDWDDVNRIFGDNQFVKLRKVIPTGSDSHKGGKQVLIYEFSDNKEQRHKVVYKPSDVEIDYRLIGDTEAVPGPMLGIPAQESLTEITNRMLRATNRTFAEQTDSRYTIDTYEDAILARLSLPTYRILPRNPGSTLLMTDGKLNIQQSYGYLEFVSHNPTLRSPFSAGDSARKKEIARRWSISPPEERVQFDWITENPLDGTIFYRQWGQLMAMTHVFSITDLHMQNQIVSHKKPTLIDLEVAFNAPGDNLGGSGIIQNYQAEKDPDQHNELAIGEGFNEFIPAGLERHQPDNKHPHNQLFYYAQGEGGEVKVLWEKETERRAALYEGVYSLLAAYRVPINNSELRGWLEPLKQLVVRLVPRPTKDFIKALSDLVEKHSRDKYPPENDEQRWQLFTDNNNKNAISQSLTSWWLAKYKARYFLEFPDPFPILEHPDHNWYDLGQMDVPSYYRRIGELHLFDARGEVVNIRHAINSQYKWLSSNGLVAAEVPLPPMEKFQAMLKASLKPKVPFLEEDEMEAFPGKIPDLNPDMFINGYYFSKTGIDQTRQRLLGLGRGNDAEFKRYVTVLMRKSFGSHSPAERKGIFNTLFNSLSN